MSQYIPTEAMALAPWDRVVRQLWKQGHASVPAAFRPSLLGRLALEGRWGPLTLGKFGPAGGSELTVPLSQASAVVRDLVLRLSASLAVASELQNLPEPPLFNQVSWTWRAAASPHDLGWGEPGELTGLAAVVVLLGSEVFEETDAAGHRRTWHMDAGHLMFVRAGDWPKPGFRRPRCRIGEVLPPGCLDMVFRTRRAQAQAGTADGSGPPGGAPHPPILR